MIAGYTQINNITFGSSIPLLFFYILGVIGPAIAGIIVSKKFETKEGFKTFLRRCYRPPKNLKWYLFIVAIVLVASLLPYFVIGGNQVAPVQYIFLNIPLFILIGGLEEIGWRGVMLHQLTKIMSPFRSTFIVSIVWSVWHFPLFFIIGTYQFEHLNIPIFTISVISFSFLLSTIYYKTNSVFLCIITHALYNSVLDVFINDQSLFGEIVVLAFSLVIFFIFANNRRHSLITKHSHVI